MTLSKSGIEYLTHSWSPVVGCRVGCSYCWARPLARRIGKSIVCRLCEEFVPHVHPERLQLPDGRPKVIGVGFMTDLWGPPFFRYRATALSDCNERWHREKITRRLVQGITEHPEHVFVTVTKFPENLPDLEWPDNWWVGATCTNQDEVDRRVRELLRSGVKHPVLNLEPLCEDVVIPQRWLRLSAVCRCGPAVRKLGVEGAIEPDFTTHRGCPECGIAWTGFQKPLECVILGGMSRQGRDHKPVPLHPDSVRSVRDQCAQARIPFYFKQHSDANPGEYEYLTADKGCPPSAVALLDGRMHRELPGRWGETLKGEQGR